MSETYSRYPDLSIPFLHYSADAQGPVPTLNTAWDCAAERGVWNTYTLEWDATKLQIWANGTLCLVNTSQNAMMNKRYITAFTSAMGPASTGYEGIDAGPKTLEVDYVRVWK